MGYCVSQVSSTDVLIKKKNFPRALKAVKALAGGGTIPSSGGRHYSWVTDSDYVKAKTLKEALQAWRWDLEVNEDGDGVDLRFDGEKLGDDTIVLKAVAPFFESGEIEMEGEDGTRWKWAFRKGKFRELSGRVIYEDDGQ